VHWVLLINGADGIVTMSTIFCPFSQLNYTSVFIDIVFLLLARRVQ
jgi:hypothetical protein